jgi:hypothetical protein
VTNPLNTTHPEPNARRTFLKRLALGLAALGAYAALNRRPLGGLKRDRRSIPADLPGIGSIFQPRNDRRSSRP